MVSADTKKWNIDNIAAFVQAVLRESYMLQSEQLLDFANKVKHHNAERKAIRAELDRVRTHLTTVESGSENETMDQFSTELAYTAKNQAAHPIHANNPVYTIDGPAPLYHEPDPSKRDIITYHEPHAGSNDYKVFGETAEQATQSLIKNTIEFMSPEEKRALLDYFSKNPLTAEFKCADSDKKNNLYHWGTKSSKPYLGDTLESFLTRAISEQMDRFRPWSTEKRVISMSNTLR